MRRSCERICCQLILINGKKEETRCGPLPHTTRLGKLSVLNMQYSAVGLILRSKSNRLLIRKCIPRSLKLTDGRKSQVGYIKENTNGKRQKLSKCSKWLWCSHGFWLCCRLCDEIQFCIWSRLFIKLRNTYWGLVRRPEITLRRICFHRAVKSVEQINRYSLSSHDKGVI